MPKWLQDGLNTVVDFVPRLVLFLVILLVGFLIAKALEKLVDKILEKVGFDRVVARGAAGRAMRDNGHDASDILAKVVFYAVILFALQLAFGVFGPNPVSALITSIIAFLPALFIALLIVIIGSAIAGAVADIIRSAMGGLASARIMATAAQVFIIGLSVIAALNQMGIAVTVTLPVLITVLATIGGIAIVGVGGGLIIPMRTRWERWLDHAEQEGARVRAYRANANAGDGVTSAGAAGPASQPRDPALTGAPHRETPETTPIVPPSADPRTTEGTPRTAEGTARTADGQPPSTTPRDTGEGLAP
ncbi:MAG TPA: hypothetical protein VL595_18045 [Pseudonocardia sp.]|jgi:hypothetical protein|nr:hypothetical protein [Pseudonocardia sp.]